MIERLIRFALGNRLLVIALTLLAAGAGALAFHSLPIDAFPDVSSTQVKIILKSPGMTPEEVESRIVTPLEIEMLSIPHKRVVRSISKYAIADITIDFDDGTDIYWARQQVNERLSSLLKDLPTGTDGGLAPITTPLGEMFMFTIQGDTLSLTEKRTLLDWTLRPALRTIPGVADVNALGGLVRSFEVVPDNAALHARSLTLAALKSALERNNRNDGAGRLVEGGETLLVRTEGAIRTLADIGAIVVRSNGNIVRVQDVAQVQYGALTRYGVVTRDGKGEAVQGIVLGLRGANARQLVASVHGRLKQIQPSLPAGITVDVFYDRGDLVDRAIGTVSRALAESVVMVLLVLVLFLGNFRAAVVVALALPLSALLTFIAMNWLGMSANLMSLGGLAIAIGMLVDASVVVVENIMAHQIRSGDSRNSSDRNGSDRNGDDRERLLAAVTEVAKPVLSGLLIIIVVFLPLLTLQGLEGKLFAPVAITIVLALVASLMLAFTTIPVLSSLLLRGSGHTPPRLMRLLHQGYERVLRLALAKPAIPLLIALVLLIAAIPAYLTLGKSFMPTMDEGDLLLQVEKLPSISLEESALVDGRIERAVLDNVPEVKHAIARAGADEIGLDPMGLNETDMFFVLAPREQWRHRDKASIIAAIRTTMQDFPGVAHSFTQPIEMRVSEMLTGVRGDVAVKIFGPDLTQLNALARRTVTVLQRVTGAEDVITLKNDGVQYYSVQIDRLRAGRLGLNIEDIQDLLRVQVEGSRVGLAIEAGRRTPLLLRGAESLRYSPEAFARLIIDLPDGRNVPLAEVATLIRRDGPVRIEHEDAQRMVVVRANARGRDLVGYVDEARLAFEREIKLPAGYRAVWGGQFENQQRAAQRLALVVPIALIVIFLVLYLTLGTARQAILVFVNVPLALLGGVFALWLAGEYLSVPASVGFIALLGIAVLNGLVMMSQFNQLAAGGIEANSTGDADADANANANADADAKTIADGYVERLVIEGSQRRLRPVLMTATITSLGLIPLVLATGPGSEIQRPLAIVVIGGLVSSTFLTLVLLPILFRKFGLSRKVQRR